MSSTSALIVPLDPKSPSPKFATWPTSTEKVPKVGTTRVLYNTPVGGKITVLSSLGETFDTKSEEEKAEIVRKSVGSAVKAVKALEDVGEIIVDAELDPYAAAVGAHLALYSFTLKTQPNQSRFDPRLKEPIPEKFSLRALKPSKEWDDGAIVAEAQNLARTLMELPANMMTPTVFCERVKKEFAGIPDVKIIIRDEEWAEKTGMRTFLSVTRGTSEPAKFLEIHYTPKNSASAKPLALVGKGITFDSGGISLKPGSGMKLMRGDMGGAAAVVSSALAIAKLGLPVKVFTLTPLTENMPGPNATKPGDVIYAMNGKSVEVDNTDAEGRLVLADAIHYAATAYQPHTLIDVATLTGAMEIALGEVFTGAFTSSTSLYNLLHTAGLKEHDRFWRMPIDEEFGPQIYSSNADLCNTGGRPGGSCTAALFLKAFVPETRDLEWAHLDIAGVMEATRPTPYLEKGMTGRSVRALVEFVRNGGNVKTYKEMGV